jgi:hypothetical protein
MVQSCGKFIACYARLQQRIHSLAEATAGSIHGARFISPRLILDQDHGLSCAKAANCTDMPEQCCLIPTMSHPSYPAANMSVVGRQ